MENYTRNEVSLKVYDCFTYYGEEDMLDFRLHVLDPYVDFFVISECDVAFSGKAHEPVFLQHKGRFKKFEHKIIYKLWTDTPTHFPDVLSELAEENENTSKDALYRNKILRSFETYRQYHNYEPHWIRDFYQKECVLRGLLDADPDDIVLISDLDEIPRPEVVQKIISDGVPPDNWYHLLMDFHQYFFNVRKPAGLESVWYGTKIIRWGLLKELGANYIRNSKDKGIVVPKAGHHFSFCGGPDLVKEKIQASGHVEFNHPVVIENIQKNIDNDQDLYFRYGGLKFDVVDIDESFPEELRNNLSKYRKFIKNYDDSK